MQSIGDMLIEAGICTRQQIEDAVRNQVIMGGRLGTNLVSLGFIDEATLAEFLGRQHNLPSVHGPDIEPDSEALAVMTPQTVERLGVIPFEKESSRLQVLVIDPTDLAALDEAAFITGLKPSPIVVPEGRFWQLLHKLYDISRNLRSISVPPPPDYLAASFAEPKVTAEASLQEDLISEDSFDQLYQQRDGFPALEPAAEKSPKQEELPLLTAEDLEEWDDELQEVQPPEPPPPPPTAGQEPPPSPVSQEPLERRVWSSSESNRGRRAEDRLLSDQAGAPPSQPPAPLEEQPLDFQQAAALMETAGDRHAIARILLRYARSNFARCMIFTVHRARPGDPASGNFAPQRAVALGWDALGQGIDRWAFRSVMLPLDGPSVFRTVVDNRAHYLGALRKSKINIAFLKVMGKRVPLSAFVMPVLVRGRVVNVFYADDGHRKHCSNEIGELLILAQKISQSYEALFQNKREAYRKREGQAGEA